MDTAWSLLQQHYQWAFSGIGVTVLLALYGFFRWKHLKAGHSQNQHITNGKGYQAGRDITIKVEKENPDAE